MSIEQLCAHLKNISKKENGNISEDAIKLIAKTSEGSVRDSISLLDRALISQTIENNQIINEGDVREMLGLADKSKTISLFKEILNGNEKEALGYLKTLIDEGLDAKNFLNDILEVLYLFSRRINLGVIEKDLSISEAEIQMINKYSEKYRDARYRIILATYPKTLDDLRIIGNENLTLEMYVMQLVHLKNSEEKNKDETNEENIPSEKKKFN